MKPDTHISLVSPFSEHHIRRKESFTTGGIEVLGVQFKVQTKEFYALHFLFEAKEGNTLVIAQNWKTLQLDR